MTYFTPYQTYQDVNETDMNVPLGELDSGVESLRDGTLARTVLHIAAATLLTIASGVIVVTRSFHIVAAETGTTDDIDTITAERNQTFLVLKADTGDTITVKNGTGNIALPSGDMTISGDQAMLLFYDGTNWVAFNTTSIGQLENLDDVYTAGNTANYVLATPDGSTGTYRGRSLVKDDLPFNPTPCTSRAWHDEAVVIYGNALYRSTSVSQRYATYSWQTPPANADAFENGFYLRAGTYDFKVLGITTMAAGKVDWYLKADGGSYGSAFETGQDWYSNPTVYNVVKTVSSVSVASDGFYTLKGVINGRNASASDYSLILVKYWFTPTGGF